MSAYEPCNGCACHLKIEEQICPFCGAPHTPHAPVSIRLRRRVSRAHWLAFGSTLAMMSCTDSRSLHSDPGIDAAQRSSDATEEDTLGPADSAVVAEATPFDGALADGSFDVGPSEDAMIEDAMIDDADDAWADDGVARDADAAPTDDSAVADADPADAAPSDVASDGNARDASADVFVDAADARSCTPPTGTFRCVPWSGASLPDGGAYICDAATQYCMRGPWPQGCFNYDDADVADASFPPFPSQCLPCPTCECISHTSWGGGLHPCTCQDLDVGVVALSCGGCYGSPPARLERLLRSVS